MDAKRCTKEFVVSEQNTGLRGYRKTLRGAVVQPDSVWNREMVEGNDFVRLRMLGTALFVDMTHEYFEDHFEEAVKNGQEDHNREPE